MPTRETTTQLCANIRVSVWMKEKKNLLTNRSKSYKLNDSSCRSSSSNSITSLLNDTLDWFSIELRCGACVCDCDCDCVYISAELTALARNRIDWCCLDENSATHKHIRLTHFYSSNYALSFISHYIHHLYVSYVSVALCPCV